MQNMFEKSFTLRTSDFDCYRKISPAAVLDLFQVVAGEHAILLGCGFDDFYRKNLLWVLVRTKYEVINEPALYQTVKVKTWPLVPSRAGFQREYLMEDEQGNPLIKGSSDWVIIDSELRKIVSATNVYPNIEFREEKNFEQRLKKIPDFEQIGEGITLRTGFSQLDMNGHVNNTKYANYAMDALDPDQNNSIKTFQVDYRQEVKKGDEIKLYVNKVENTAVIKGVNELGEIMFATKVEM